MTHVMMAVTETKVKPIDKRSMEISLFKRGSVAEASADVTNHRRGLAPRFRKEAAASAVSRHPLAVSEKAIVIYTKRWCPFCLRAKSLLEERGYDFDEIDLTGNKERRAWLAQKSGQKTVPQIFIHGACIGGSTELVALDAAGDLGALIRG